MKELFNNKKAKEVENAVMDVFNSKLVEIIGYSDKLSKKVVVFILHKLLDMDKRCVGAAYNMSYLYVPTASNEIENLFLTDFDFRNKISCVINRIGYESKLDLRAGAVA
jgi:hypothetical protein